MALSQIVKYRKSYKAGLLQAKAFRILKKRTNEALAPFGFNATDWGILGLLFESKDGLKLKHIATELGVKPPYVTRSVKSLDKGGYLKLSSQAKDARIKVATITSKGKKFVTKTEPIVMKQILDTLRLANKRDVMGYITTLSAIVDTFKDYYISQVDLDHMAE